MRAIDRDLIRETSCTAAGLTIFTAAQLGAAEVLGQEFVFRIFSLFPIEGLLKL